jgi:hypothetical protein
MFELALFHFQEEIMSIVQWAFYEDYAVANFIGFDLFVLTTEWLI